MQTDLEALLNEGNIIQIKPQGYSMYPLFVPERDEALIEAVDPAAVRVGDVLLYRRDQGILVLHRLCRRTSEGLWFVGDNQSEVEGPLRPDQIRGKLVGFIRKGKLSSVSALSYRLTAGIWLLLLPLRPFCFRLSAFFKKLAHKSPVSKES